MTPQMVLGLPTAYRLFVRLVGGGYRDVYLREYVRPRPGERVFDIGCGPGDVVAHLPDVEYYGVDLDPNYVRAAEARFGDRGTFRCRRAADVTAEQPGSFDVVMANGLLHHLDDAEAAHTIAVARRLLKPAGRLVTFDNAFVPGQSRVARWFIRRDRGKHVRTPDGYRGLARRSFGAVECHVRHDLLRIPYTHCIMVCTGSAA